MDLTCLKRMLSAAVLALGAIVAANAQSTVSHIVKQGDTLASIANRYGITTDQLIKANPEAASFVYVGMELTIPVVPLTPNPANDVEDTFRKAPAVVEPPKPRRRLTQTTVGYKQSTVPTKVQHQQSTSKSSYCDDDRGLSYVGYLECGLINGGPIIPSLTLGVNYPFFHGLYAGLRVGYKAFIYSSDDIKAFYHLADVPVELGYKLQLPVISPVVINPYVGADIDIPVANTVKQGGVKVEPDKLGVCVSGRGGLRLRIRNFHIGGYVAIPMSADAKLLYGDHPYAGASIGIRY